MSSNIYLVRKESHVDELLRKNKDKLSILYFSAPNNSETNENIKFRKYLKRYLAPKYPDVFILYIEPTNFTSINTKNTKNKYTTRIEEDKLPVIEFVFNNTVYGGIAKANIEPVEKYTEMYLDKLKTFLETNKEKSQPPTPSSARQTQPVQTPIQTPVQTPVQPSVQQPVQQPTQQPTQQPAQQPIQPSIQPPVQPIVEVSVQQPSQVIQEPTKPDPQMLQKQLITQIKLEKIEEMKNKLMVKELEKIKKAKVMAENGNDNNDNDSEEESGNESKNSNKSNDNKEKDTNTDSESS
jgi:hypothetical protein